LSFQEMMSRTLNLSNMSGRFGRSRKRYEVERKTWGISKLWKQIALI
jgi:hypothetical protein